MQTPNTPQPAAAAPAPRPVPPPPRAAFGGCGAARVIFAVISPSFPPRRAPPPPPARFCNMEPGSRGGKGGRSHFLVHISRRLPASLASPRRRRRRAPPPLLAARPPPAGALAGAAERGGAPPPGPPHPHPRSVLTWATIPSISPGTRLCPAERGRQRHGVSWTRRPPGRPPPPPAALTFRIRFFSMLSTAKTCSPTAGSSMPQPGGAGPGVRGRRCSRAGLGLRQLPPPTRQTLSPGRRGTATRANPGARRQGGGASRARLPVNGGAGGLAQPCRGARRGGGGRGPGRGGGVAGGARAARPPPHA